MKKWILSVALVISMTFAMIPPAFAASCEAIDAANQLYQLGLFQGTGTDENGNPNFALERVASRYEAVTMLVRLLGKSEEAQAGNWDTPFTDVVEWAKPYVGYAYANGLTSGTGATVFGGEATVSASQYLTFILRALGYDSNVDFKWETAWELSDKIGLTDGEYSSTSFFSRGDIAQISYNALSTLMKGTTNTTLADTLIINGAFTQKQYSDVINGTVVKHELALLNYSYVNINGKLYEIIYSYELREPKTNIIYYEKNDPTTLYIDSQMGKDMWTDIITLALMTNTCQLIPSNNPFLDGAIDMFSTYYDKTTIDVQQIEHYINTTESYYTIHHSYNGKTLDIPYTNKTGDYMLNDVAFYGKYINVEDYCKFFSLDVSMRVEFNAELKQNILVVEY
ncbi:S-layer homology domain-containing protein [Pseudoflavonifractor capillosus]|uniref:S-layer homology domain-containing protein n=1 Tax=Pseudoflavonifractor capillosus TaxID=106588 RepID=A0A921ST10_9FIRM|nr:S-layer homology domain-containing protein [Pseudoflavonifractor capillosus]HJG87410.1 S-layer homology domain-containing protein [Pseudoflavonifractor capillosus]